MDSKVEYKIPQEFFVDPVNAKCNVTKKHLQYLLLNEPVILARGRTWDWVFKHLGVGVYQISLKERYK